MFLDMFINSCSQTFSYFPAWVTLSWSGSCFFLRPLWHRQSYPYSRPQQAHNDPLSFCSSPCHLSTLFFRAVLLIPVTHLRPVCPQLFSSTFSLIIQFSLPPKILLSWTWDLKEFLSCKGWQVHKAKKRPTVSKVMLLTEVLKKPQIAANLGTFFYWICRWSGTSL